MRHVWALGVLLCVVWPSGTIETSAHAQVKVHVVIATDSRDPIIGRFVASDNRTISGTMGANIAEEQIEFYPIEPDQMRPADIHNRILNLPVGANDAVLFYYSGHGGYDATGQFFSLERGTTRLYRHVVRAAIESKQPRLGVLISDCCYAFLPDPNPSGVAPALFAQTKPLFDELFFRARGLVDITSSQPGEISSCYLDDADGSIFTKSLSDILWDVREQRLSWKQVFEMTRRRASAEFARVHPTGAKAPFMTVPQRTQTAWAFRLEPEGPRFDAAVQFDPQHRGVRITGLAPNGSVQSSGFEIGDVILSVNQRPLNRYEDFVNAIDTSPQRAQAEIRNVRDGSILRVPLNLKY